MSTSVKTRLRMLALALMVLTLTGCSTLGKTAGDRLDPWENWNRKVFGFNESLDKNVLKPVATVYSNIVPRPVRRGIDNFFGNAADAWSAINNLLQGKVEASMQDLFRFGTNTLFGLGGVLDVASEMGLEHHYEDFGQTLGVWGVKSGPYVVWPLLGPSAVRESLALPLDISVSPSLIIGESGSGWVITPLRLINTRANLLGATQVIDDIALDKYTFVRDGYLQRRRSLVLDGQEPKEDDPSKDDAPAAPAGAASVGAANLPTSVPAAAASSAKP